MDKKKEKLVKLNEKEEKLKLALVKSQQELEQLQSQIAQAKNEMIEEKFASLGMSFLEALDLIDELGTDPTKPSHIENNVEDTVNEAI